MGREAGAKRATEGDGASASGQAAPSARAARKIENRRTLIDAGRRVFAEIGLEASTVRDIVRASGLAQGSFYNYFDSKDAVFAVVVDEVIAPVRASLHQARREATDARGFVQASYSACVALTVQEQSAAALIRRNQNAFRAVFYQGDELSGAVLSELIEDLEIGTARGLFAPHDARLMAESMMSAGVDLIIACLNAPDETERRLAFVAELFAKALSVER